MKNPHLFQSVLISLFLLIGVSSYSKDLPILENRSRITVNTTVTSISPSEGYAGTDVEPLQEQGAAAMELLVESQRYFDYHHTPIDTFDKVNKRELELGAATLAAFIYWIDTYGL